MKGRFFLLLLGLSLMLNGCERQSGNDEVVESEGPAIEERADYSHYGKRLPDIEKCGIKPDVKAKEKYGVLYIIPLGDEKKFKNLVDCITKADDDYMQYYRMNVLNLITDDPKYITYILISRIKDTLEKYCNFKKEFNNPRLEGWSSTKIERIQGEIRELKKAYGDGFYDFDEYEKTLISHKAK